MPSDCAVEILLPAFRLAFHQIDQADELLSASPPEGHDAAFERLNAGWDHLWSLSDCTLDAEPNSEIGVTLQLALAFDAMVILEAMRLGDEGKETICRRVRSVIRHAITRLDVTAVREAGVLTYFMGERLPDAPLGVVAYRRGDVASPAERRPTENN